MGKIASKDLVFKLGIGTNLATVGIFDPNLDEAASEINVTDTNSIDGEEFLSGYVNRQISFAKWFKDDDTDQYEVGDVLSFSWKVGAKTFSGSLTIMSRKMAAAKEDAHRFDFTARISGGLSFV